LNLLYIFFVGLSTVLIYFGQEQTLIFQARYAFNFIENVIIFIFPF